MSDIPALADFRQQTRIWLEQNCPAEMRQPMLSEEEVCWGGRNWQFGSEAQQVWLQRMVARGWTVPTWAREYGGGGLTAEEGKVLAQEMNTIGCRSPLNSFGIWMLGPALLKFGTEAQKLEHMSKIARGEIRQRHRRRIQPLTVLGQQRFGRLKQLRARQDVEELNSLRRSRSAFNAAATLMQNALGITIHGQPPPFAFKFKHLRASLDAEQLKYVPFPFNPKDKIYE